MYIQQQKSREMVNEKTIKYWKHLTDINQHTLVRDSIAKHFNYKNYMKVFGEIAKKNCLTFEDAIKRKHYTDMMLRRISVEYGDDTYNLIKSCL